MRGKKGVLYYFMYRAKSQEVSERVEYRKPANEERSVRSRNQVSIPSSSSLQFSRHRQNEYYEVLPRMVRILSSSSQIRYSFFLLWFTYSYMSFLALFMFLNFFFLTTFSIFNNEMHIIMCQQQHSLPKGRSGAEDPSLCLPKLRSPGFFL